MQHRVLSLSLLAGALALGACQRTDTAPSKPLKPATATVPASAPKSVTRPDDNLNAVLWMQASVEYRPARSRSTVPPPIGSIAP
jgi:acid phosphatase